MPDRKITLVAPDGRRTQATEKEAARLAIFGYRPETQEEAIDRLAEKHTSEFYDTAGQKALTTLEGVASGATLGLADPLMADEDTRERAYRHPAYRIGGEIGGAIIPAVLSAGATAEESAATVGAKAVGTIARALPAGRASSVALGAGEAIGGIRGAAVAGAIEGGIAGAGSALTESSLSGDPLTAESVIAHAGAGTLLGMGVGAASEAMIGLGRARHVDEIESLVPGMENQTDDLASFYKSLPAEKKPKLDTTPEWIKAAENTPDDDLIRKYTQEVPDYKTRKNWRVASDESFDNIRAEVGDAVKTARVVDKDLDGALAKASADAKEFRRQAESSAASLRAEVGRVRREAADTLARNQQERRVIESEFIPLEDGYKSLQEALKTADPVKAQNLVERYKASIRANPHFVGARGASLPGVPDPKVALRTRDALKAADEALTLSQARRVLADFPVTQEAFLKMTGPKAEKLFAAVDALPNSISVGGIDRMLSEAGIEVTGSPGTRLRALWELRSGQPGSTIEQVGTKQAARAEFKLPDVKSRLTSVPDIKPHVDPNLPGLPPKPPWPEIVDTKDAAQTVYSVGKSTRKPTSHAASLWHRIGRLAASRQASAAAKKAGLGVAGSAVAYELGGSAAASLFGGSFIAGIAGVKGAVMGRIASAAAKYAPALGRGMKRLAPRIDPLAVRIDGTLDESRDRRQLLKNRSEEITKIGAGYRDAMFKAVEPLIGEHPEFAVGITEAYSTAFAGLMKFLPRDPGMAFTRLKSLWSPTDIQLNQFAKAYAVYHDPVGTIEAVMETGAADATTVAALKEMYPSLYGELQMKMVERLTDPKFLNSLSYNDQARLSILLDIPLHSSFTPRSIAATQAMYRQQKQPQPAPSQEQGGGRPAKTEPPTAGQSLIQPGGM